MKKLSLPCKHFSTQEEIVNDTIFQKDSCNYSIMDMKGLMELLNATDDTDELVKLFNVMAVYLVSNDTCKGEISTNNHIYDKIRNVLSDGHSPKIIRTLNFLTALLYSGEEERGPCRAKTLISYAQNMIRISGCLLILCNMFTSSMMRHETWRALCQCLAELCCNCTENQSYCSHLVPVAVQKCLRGNVEALETLKSLIYNHTYNTQLFLDSNGLNIFKRSENLMNDTSMQLLSSLIPNTSPEILNIIHQNVYQNVCHLKLLYGTQNRIGQWATIVWHQLNSRSKDIKGYITENNLNRDDYKENNKEKKYHESSAIDIGFSKPDDTARLLQNVIREIHNYNAKTNVIQNMGRKTDEVLKKDTFNVLTNNHSKKHPTKSKEFETTQMNTKPLKPVDRNISEMTFSFLLKAETQGNIELKKNNISNETQINNPTATETSICFQLKTKPHGESNHFISKRIATSTSCSSAFDIMDLSDLDFNPVIASTPKKPPGRRTSSTFLRMPSERYYQHTAINTFAKINDKTQNNARHRKKIKSKQTRQLKKKIQTPVNKQPDIKNRSMTSRLFHAINDSCTTFVKTVTNIFKSKKNDDKNNLTVSIAASTRSNIEDSCSYSFTDYMRRRDALLSKETTESRNNLTEINVKSCKTCDNTVFLKQKVNNDKFLKETLKKLKFGINMYGCDFKKISKSIWPRETYMTPVVLYNLYRKLIAK